LIEASSLERIRRSVIKFKGLILRDGQSRFLFELGLGFDPFAKSIDEPFVNEGLVL